MTPPSVSTTLRRPARGDRPVRMLLLHGMGGGPTGWGPLVPLIRPDVEIWEATLPWAGLHDAGWAVDGDAVGWVRAAVDRLPDGRPHVVVAHSFAANAVLELIDSEPRWTVATVLIAPFYRATTAEFSWDSVRQYFEGFRLMLDEGLILSTGGRPEPDVRTEMVDRLCDWLGPYTWIRFFDTYLRTPALSPSRFTAPVLLISGADDPGALVGGVLALGRSIPDARTVIIPDTGHFAMVEQPDAVAASVNQFVRRLTCPAESRWSTPHPVECGGVSP